MAKTEDLVTLFIDDTYGLKLSLEQKEKRTIHFLDVQLQITDNTLVTTIYRKPEATPVIISRWSNDKWAYKKAVIKAYLSRAISHCSTDTLLKEEIQRIETIAQNHGYSRALVRKQLKEITDGRKNGDGGHQEQHSQDISLQNQYQATEYEVIPDTMQMSRTVTRVLRRRNRRPAYKWSQTVFQALKNLKDLYDKDESVGVYKIPLENIDKGTREVYVGTT